MEHLPEEMIQRPEWSEEMAIVNVGYEQGRRVAATVAAAV